MYSTATPNPLVFKGLEGIFNAGFGLYNHTEFLHVHDFPISCKVIFANHSALPADLGRPRLGLH